MYCNRPGAAPRESQTVLELEVAALEDVDKEYVCVETMRGWLAVSCWRVGLRWYSGGTYVHERQEKDTSTPFPNPAGHKASVVRRKRRRGAVGEVRLRLSI
jgi:hypothetical protein